MAGKKGANLQYTDQELLDALVRLYERTGELPSESIIAREPDMAAVGTYKARFGSLRSAQKLAGLPVPKDEHPTAERCLEELRRLKELLGHWPTQKDLQKLRRDDLTPWSFMLYHRRFGGLSRALELAGAKPGLDYSRQALIAELHRLRDIELPGKAAGASPSPADIKGPHCPYSEMAFKKLGPRYEDWMTAAGLPPRLQRKRDGRTAILSEYKALYDELRRLPNSVDVRRAGLDYTAVGRYFENLRGLRDALELPLESPFTALRGLDCLFYDSNAERDLADRLFAALLEQRIVDYEPHFQVDPSRRWSIDFRVTLADDAVVLVEYDGYGTGRPRDPYNKKSSRLQAISSLGAPLWIVSRHHYDPWFGELMSIDDFVARLAPSRAHSSNPTEFAPRWNEEHDGGDPSRQFGTAHRAIIETSISSSYPWCHHCGKVI